MSLIQFALVTATILVPSNGGKVNPMGDRANNAEQGSNRPAVKSLVYYQKPAIGSSNGATSAPVLLKYPGGAIGIAVSNKNRTPAQENPNQPLDRYNSVIASGPINTILDIKEKNMLKIAFLVVAFVNLVITSALYFNADTVDTSKVENPTQNTPTVFEKVPSQRRQIETINYAFTFIVLIMGSASVVFESALGVSAYCLAIVLNFLLGTSSLPYFVYSSRYVFDCVMLYLALVFRSKIVYNFLPLHFQRV